MFTKVALLGALMLTSLAATSANAIKAYQDDIRVSEPNGCVEQASRCLDGHSCCHR